MMNEKQLNEIRQKWDSEEFRKEKNDVFDFMMEHFENLLTMAECYEDMMSHGWDE